MYRTLPDYIYKDTISGRGELHTLNQDGSLSSFLVLFGSRWYSSACIILAAGRSLEWWLAASYMILVCVIYDDRLRHIWCKPTSYMMQAHAIHGVNWCRIGCRLMPNMPPSCTLDTDVWRHLSWGCYTLVEWVIFMLPSRRETATLSVNGGGWSYTLSEWWKIKCLIMKRIDSKKWPLYYTIYSNIYTLLYFLYYT